LALLVLRRPSVCESPSAISVAPARVVPMSISVRKGQEYRVRWLLMLWLAA
jgi:hypothetical protein